MNNSLQGGHWISTKDDSEIVSALFEELRKAWYLMFYMINLITDVYCFEIFAIYFLEWRWFHVVFFLRLVALEYSFTSGGGGVGALNKGSSRPCGTLFVAVAGVLGSETCLESSLLLSTMDMISCCRLSASCWLLGSLPCSAAARYSSAKLCMLTMVSWCEGPSADLTRFSVSIPVGNVFI